MPAFFDSHSHLQDRAFAHDLEEVLGRAWSAGVVGIAVLGYDPESNIDALRLAESHAGLHAAVGIHPHDADAATTAVLTEVESLARSERVAAIGEVGLDHFRMLSEPARQRAVLEEQLAIALRTAKPVAVHSRGAEAALVEPLGEFARGWRQLGTSRPPGVMHCFGGSLEQARVFAELGFLVSLACAITYPRNVEARLVAAELPLASLLIETDSPHLPPQQMRGRRNEPTHVIAAAEGVARVRGITPAAVAEATTRNAEWLFGLAVASPAGAER